MRGNRRFWPQKMTGHEVAEACRREEESEPDKVNEALEKRVFESVPNLCYLHSSQVDCWETDMKADVRPAPQLQSL